MKKPSNKPAANTDPTVYTIEVVSREWGGTLRDGWRPAIAGMLNQTTHFSDEDASTICELSAALRLAHIAEEQGADEVRITRCNGEVVYYSQRQYTED